MKPKIKQQWLAALRSGTYAQGYKQLRQGEKFCCLGVLCDLHAKATKKAWEESARNPGAYYYQENSVSLPSVVRKWAGIDYEYGEYGEDEDSLAAANDAGQSLQEIADLIEQHF